MTCTSTQHLKHARREDGVRPGNRSTTHTHFRLALMGLGTVGQALCRLIEDRRADLFVRHGISFTVTHVLVRNAREPRKTIPHTARIHTERVPFLKGKFDLAVECMGGIEPAYSLTSSLLKRGIPVVSANKALLAEHGKGLLGLAEKHDTRLRFEASVAAGIPILGVIERALQSMTVTRICAILNGTSNYILTRMTDEGLSLQEALNHAQQAGFAEADPSLDLKGLDAAQKLTVLARALGAGLPTGRIDTGGIDTVNTEDCKQANAFGFALKPVAVAEIRKGEATGFVSPALIRFDHALAGVSGVANGVHLTGRPLGSLFFSGPGAGALPTAASILDDLLVLALDADHSRRRAKRKTAPTEGAHEEKTKSPLPVKTESTLTSLNDRTTSMAQTAASGTGMNGHWFLSLQAPHSSVEDILDFLAASGVVFRSLQERQSAGKLCLAGITTTMAKKRFYTVLEGLKEAGAIEGFRAYPVVDPFGKEESR